MRAEFLLIVVLWCISAVCDRLRWLCIQSRDPLRIRAPCIIYASVYLFLDNFWTSASICLADCLFLSLCVSLSLSVILSARVSFSLSVFLCRVSFSLPKPSDYSLSELQNRLHLCKWFCRQHVQNKCLFVGYIIVISNCNDNFHRV